MRQVVFRKLGVRQINFFQWRLLPGYHLHQRARSVNECAAQLGKAHIAPAGNHVVGQRDDGLVVQLVAHLRPAQHHAHIGAQCLELAHHLGGLDHVPDVHAKADDGCGGRFVRHRSQGGKQILHHLRYRPRQRVLPQHRSGSQVCAAMPRHIGPQIAQPQRRVDIARIQRSQNDDGVIRHGRIIKACGLSRARPKLRTELLGSQPELTTQ